MLRTTSQIIDHYSKMEENQAENYQRMTEKLPGHSDFFKKLAKDNLQHRDRVRRAYRLGVTDAFEVGFISNSIDKEDYAIEGVSSDSPPDALIRVIINEEKIISYLEAAVKSSGELIPDLPNTYEYIIKMKKRRIEQLKKLVK